ncbi:MAG: hypothetical protein FWG88_10790 [Oscillospiraceae bacterium]|nr:hypothetical protein [Oscillospiraceae bacterium]
MNTRSKSTLFLMEQLIVIGTFALCAAACVRIFASSYFMAVEARDLSYGIRVAESGAECYKAVSGDLVIAADILGGKIVDLDEHLQAVIFYDKDWELCDENDETASYALKLIGERESHDGMDFIQGSLVVSKLSGDDIISFPISTRYGHTRGMAYE